MRPRRPGPPTATILSMLIVGALLLGACGSDDPVDTPDPNAPTDPITPDPQQPDDESSVLRSELSRNTSPAVPAGDEQALVAGNNAFAFDLYHQLLKGRESDNLFCSPASVSQALAMVYAGAKANTAAQMASSMHFTLDPASLHPAFNALDLALNSRGAGAAGKDGQGFRLNLVNALWAQRGYPVTQSFLDTLGQSYGAGVRVLEFNDQPDASRQTINAWVEQETENRIKELLPAGSVTSATRMVLTNAIYFNAAWSEVFSEDRSADGAFSRLDGSRLTVPRMSQVTDYRYASDAGWQAVELPYDGEELSMVVIVPDAGQFEAVEAKLDARLFDAAVGAMTHKHVSLTLPKWKVESKFRLKEQLKALGMTDAFSGARADFSGINGGIEPLWISDVIHQSFVEVDEKGTEAAAATAVVMVGSAGPVETIDLTVDRPFIFAIRDIPTGSILFVGRVVDPTK